MRDREQEHPQSERSTPYRPTRTLLTTLWTVMTGARPTALALAPTSSKKIYGRLDRNAIDAPACRLRLLLETSSVSSIDFDAPRSTVAPVEGALPTSPPGHAEDRRGMPSLVFGHDPCTERIPAVRRLPIVWQPRDLVSPPIADSNRRRSAPAPDRDPASPRGHRHRRSSRARAAETPASSAEMPTRTSDRRVRAR